MPSFKSKEGSGGEPEKENSSEKRVLSFFNSYRARPDKPKYSYEEQNILGKKMEEARKRFEDTKNPEDKKELDELSAEFLEGKKDKKHISTLWTPLLAAQLYLEDEGRKKLSAEAQTAMRGKIDELLAKLDEARAQEHMSDELIAESLDFMNKFENYLK